MVALAIMSLAVAFMMPRAAAALDQVVVHTVHFDIQRQIGALKRQAVMTNTVLVVGGQPTRPDPAADADAPAPVEQKAAELTLRSGWSYKLSAPLVIDTDGRCSPVDIDLMNYQQKIVHLQGQADCVFIRTVTPTHPGAG
jgi:hypothetical protein